MIVPLMWIVLFTSMAIAAGVVLGIMDVAETLYFGYKLRREGYKLTKNENGVEIWSKD
jgi:hypothetical protein